MKLTKELIVEAGGKVWEKNNIERVYFKNRTVVAKLFNYAIVNSIGGVIPAGFKGMITEGITKSYYDVKNDTVYADDGLIANACRANNVSVIRL